MGLVSEIDEAFKQVVQPPAQFSSLSACTYALFRNRTMKQLASQQSTATADRCYSCSPARQEACWQNTRRPRSHDVISGQLPETEEAFRTKMDTDVGSSPYLKTFLNMNLSTGRSFLQRLAKGRGSAHGSRPCSVSEA